MTDLTLPELNVTPEGVAQPPVPDNIGVPNPGSGGTGTTPSPASGGTAPTMSAEQLARAQAMMAGLRQTDTNIRAGGGRSFFDTVTEGVSSVASDIGRGAMEAIPAAGRGVLRAIDAGAATLESAIGDTAVGRALSGAAESVGMSGTATPVADDFIDRPETVTGSLVEAVSQFVVGFGAAGGAFRILGGMVGAAGTATGVSGLVRAGSAMRGGAHIGERSSVAAGVVRGMAQGGVSDATFFDPQETRLSNLIEEYPALQNPVTEFLAAQPGDTDAEGRVKNVLEGMALGGLADTFLQSLRAIALRRAGRLDEAARATEGIPTPSSTDDILRRDRLTPEEVEARRQADAPDPNVQSTTPSGEAPRQGEMDLGEPARPRPAPDGPEQPRSGDAEQPTTGRTEDPAQADMDLRGGRANDPEANIRDNPRAEGFQPQRAERLVTVTPDDLAQLEMRVGAEQGYGRGRNLGGVRLDLVEGGEDLAAIMSSLRIHYQDAFARQIGGNENGVRSLDRVRENADRLARSLGADPDLLWQRMVSVNGITHNLDAEVTMYRDLLTTSGNRLRELAEAVGDPRNMRTVNGISDRVELMNEFRRAWERHANITLAFKGIQTGIARSLNAMRLDARMRRTLAFAGDTMFEGGEDTMQRMARRVLTATGSGVDDGGVAALNRITSGGWVRNATGVVNEFWVNSLLSGVRTHATNVMSNALATLVDPVERMVAGSLRVGTRAGRAEFVDGARQFYALGSSVNEAVMMSARALAQGDTVLDPAMRSVDTRAAITNTNLGITDPVSAMIVDGLGNTIRLPTRMLMAEDEFFKQLNYRARLRVAAWREASERGLSGADRTAYVNQRLDAGTDATGRATDELHLRAAREVTFSGDLAAQTWSGGRTFGESMMDMAQAHPGMRFIMPFIRTPTNIIRWTWNRTPIINGFRAQYNRDFRGLNGPEAQSRAWAQMATGATMWASAGYMALTDQITGGGPTDPAQRRALEATGWRPYSYRFENEDGSVEYRSYQRFDPFASFLGVVSDLAEVSGFLDDRDLEQVAMDGLAAMARQLQNKTYLSGLTNFLGALADPEQRGARAMYRFAGSFVPSILARDVNSDPLMREVRSMVDAFRARTPGYSERVDPVRNVLGETVRVPVAWGPDWLSPIATGTEEDARGGHPNTPEWRHTVQTDVKNELARQLSIHDAALRPPPPRVGTVDLTELRAVTGRSAYDRLQELTGTVRVGGMSLNERLSEVINGPTYRESLTDGTFDHDGTRIALLRSVVGTYRSVAMQEMRNESPYIDSVLRADQERSLRVLMGR